MLLERLLGRVDERLALVLRVGELAHPVRLVGVRLGLVHHPLDLVVLQARAALDPDLLLVARPEILRRDVDDPVRVDVERHLDLRHAARRRRDADELELAERLVERRHLGLALEHVDLDRRLVVLGGREHLRLLRRDGRVALDQLREHAALRLDPERERRDVEKQDVLDLALEDARLDAGADGDDLVRVDALVRLLADDLLDLVLHRRHAGHAADEDDVVDVRGRQAGVGERLLRRADRPLDEVVRQLVQLRARELQVEVLRPVLGRGDERQVDLRRRGRRELDLRLLGRLVQPLERHRVLREVDALLAQELRDHPVDDRLVEVVAAEVVVAVRRLHLEDAVAELEHRHVERAAAEVEDEDRLVGLLVEPVGERRRRRLVDDAEHVQAGDLAGVLRRLTLRVVEVRGDGDDGVRDRLAEIGLGVRLQLLQDHRRDLRRRILLVARLARARRRSGRRRPRTGRWSSPRRPPRTSGP